MDAFLSEFHDKDFDELVSGISNERKSRSRSRRRPASQRPPEPKLPPRRPPTYLAQDPRRAVVQSQAQPTEVPPSAPVHAASLPSAAASSSAPQANDEIAKLTAAIQDIQRRVHNSERGGRNALYWQVRKQYGEEAARHLYIPGTPSTSKVLQELKPTEVTTPPPPTVPVAASRGFVPPPPPPPPTRQHLSSSAVAAPWRTQVPQVAPPPKGPPPAHLMKRSTP